MKASDPRPPRGGGARRAIFALLLCALFSAALARNGDEPLNYYGLVTLSDKAVGARLAARFKARGQPVFLVRDLNTGLGQDDIMRFSDKAVLVDGDVWSTLQAEGALEKLTASPVVRVQGQTRGQSWEQRSNLVSGDRQKKAFRLGAELLRVLEENFGGTPQANQLTFEFNEGHLTLLAPTALLDQLQFSTVRKVMRNGRPIIVSEPPNPEQFANRPFEFQVWGADPSDPSASLAYQLHGALPPGLTWNAADHALRGTPTAAGRWRFTAEVRNSQGFRDTLEFAVRFRVNQAPSISGAPKPNAVAGQEWRFDMTVSDPDHPGYALKVQPVTLPKGMIFNADSLSLRWTPDTSLAGSRHAFALSVEDPLGAKREFRSVIQVISKQGNLLAEGIKIDLPWDTLVRGRNYAWRTRGIASAWAGQGIQLRSIEGSDSTLYTGDTLRIRPMAAGLHQLEFSFLAQGVPVTQRISVPVRNDKPPEFVTEMGDWKIAQGDEPHRYRPVAVDPEGEPVTMQAELPDESPLKWDGKRLTFLPGEAGVFPARFIAKDAGGNSAEQWVAYRSKPQKTGMHWILENRTMGEFTAWSATADFGTGRIGLYSPNLTYGLVPYSHWMYKEPPFFFLGGNLMGREAEKKDRRLWVDGGVTFRSPGRRLVTGGLYARIDGEWHFPNFPLSWIEMESSAQVHQFFVATDTSGLWILIADSTEGHNIKYHHVLGNGTLSDVLRDAYQKDNATAFTRVEALGAVGYGVYAGPSAWREDNLILAQHVQRFGGALRYRFLDDPNLYQATVRLGWGPGSGWGAYGTLRIALGSGF